eukprot:TRINITY_DN6164_c0_g1_i1.p1 TRINITY_DN6164_c0_g1~~TRINITY_DN6164_c0_g1_i1.p1  ORF type:complete len:920 (-),score=242.64 TRINITY_DN6164_c0_g1_i1:272-3031(-)
MERSAGKSLKRRRGLQHTDLKPTCVWMAKPLLSASTNVASSLGTESSGSPHSFQPGLVFSQLEALDEINRGGEVRTVGRGDAETEEGGGVDVEETRVLQHQGGVSQQVLRQRSEVGKKHQQEKQSKDREQKQQPLQQHHQQLQQHQRQHDKQEQQQNEQEQQQQRQEQQQHQLVQQCSHGQQVEQPEQQQQMAPIKQTIFENEQQNPCRQQQEGERQDQPSPQEVLQQQAKQQQEATTSEEQLQRVLRSVRRKKHPPVLLEDLSSRKEEEMVRKAMANSLALGHREQSTFDFIVEAPVYEPSHEEFADPVAFISSIRAEAEQFGLCKIRPPPGWEPPFCLDPDAPFMTRRQRIDRLQRGEGFDWSRVYSWEEYKRMALEFEAQWWARWQQKADSEGATRNPPHDQLSPEEKTRILEEEFWRVVETESAEMEVEYGSDLSIGSGFPQVGIRPRRAGANEHEGQEREEEEVEKHNAYAQSPWNLMRLAQLPGSLLEFMDDQVPGVIVPWVYIGMLFTAFCFHTEDNFLYSVNYHHLGAPKTWYGVPAASSSRFEKAMRDEVAELFDTRPNLLHELVTALSPRSLLARRVEVFRVVQNPGEFVITFPKAYHAGFNQGFNCAEAVNFAPADWLPFGALGMEENRRHKKGSAVSFHELLCRAASCPYIRPDTAPRLVAELSQALERQGEERDLVVMQGTVRSRRRKGTGLQSLHSQQLPPSLQEEAAELTASLDLECAMCHCHPYLAAVVCGCRPTEAACLQCSAQFCACGPAKRTMVYAVSLADLEKLLGRSKTAVSAGKAHQCGGTALAKKGSHGGRRNSALTRARLESYRSGRASRAVEWVHQAQEVVRLSGRRGQHQVILELLQQAEEFLWGGSEMDGVRALAGQLDLCHSLSPAPPFVAFPTHTRTHPTKRKVADAQRA